MENISELVARTALRDTQAKTVVAEFELNYDNSRPQGFEMYSSNANAETIAKEFIEDLSRDDVFSYRVIGEDGRMNTFRYSHIFNTPLLQVMNENAVGRKVYILGYIYSKSTPAPMTIEDSVGKKHRVSVCKLTLKDHLGTEIDCLPIPLDEHSNLDQLKSVTLLLFEGTILSEIDLWGRYVFYLKKIHDCVNPLHLIGVNEEEFLEVKTKLKNLKLEDKTVRQYIKETLVKNLGIKGLDDAMGLDQAIDFMILQSFSRGMNSDWRYCNKLHSLVIGPPAIGKKLLTMIARVLNPVAFEITSSAAKVTPAGMVGNAVRKGRSYISNPGYMPLANDGIICIQDYHEISQNSDKLSGIFSIVMEDGKVVDSTSARTEHIAMTSIHLDTNKLDQVRPDKDYKGILNQINIPLNIISRFDFVIDIPPNLLAQFEVVLKMAGGEKALLTNNYRFQSPKWQRDLKVMVAFHSTIFSSTIITEKYSKLIQSMFDQLIKANERYAESQKHFPGMLTRLYNSVEKIVKAIACSEASLNSTIDSDNSLEYLQLMTITDERYINEALEFIKNKLEYLSQLEHIEIPVSPEEQYRMDIIYNYFQGEELSLEEIYDTFSASNRTKISSRTIYRDIKKLLEEGKVYKVRKGYYQRSDFQNDGHET